MRSIRLSIKAHSIIHDNSLHDMRNNISQSGTAGECFMLCFIGVIIAAIVIVLMAVTGCGVEQPALYSEEQFETPDTVTTPTVEVSEALEVPETPDTTETPAENTPAAQSQGETKVFEYDTYFTEERPPFSVEITNVSSERKESFTSSDDPLMNLEWIVYECYPGAVLTVINADMTDGSLIEYGDGSPYPNWHIYTNSGDLIHITDDMEPLTITDDMAGIGSDGVSVLIFEFRD